MNGTKWVSMVFHNKGNKVLVILNMMHSRITEINSTVRVSEERVQCGCSGYWAGLYCKLKPVKCVTTDTDE